VATLTVWRFPTPHGADEAEYTLKMLESQELIKLYDAAVVSWEEGAKKPRTRQLKNLTSAGMLGGSFWGLLFGLVFALPVLGVAVGAAFGALKGTLSDAGIDDEFIRSVRAEVTPGTSAIFVMSSDAVIDKVKEAFASQEMELISTNLSSEQEQALLKAFEQ
jgi:uncharacterized membrane protein